MDASLPIAIDSPLPAFPANRSRSTESTPEAMEHVAAEFESVFMSLLIKEMRETTEDGLFAGEASDSYGALFDLYLGQHMADAGGIGIKQMLLARYTDNQPRTSP